MIYSLFFKTTFLISILSFISTLGDFDFSNPLLILNMDNQATLPKNFRLSTFPLGEGAPLPCIHGLAELRASASGQFSEKSLQKMLEVIPEKKVLMIDLRQESHGYIDGIAVSWYGKHDWGNIGKNLHEVLFDETLKLNQLREEASLVIYDAIQPFTLEAKRIFSEKELISQYGIHYVRLPVTDHLKPDDETIDHFLNIVAADEGQSWVHFHCAAGRGRATTFMCLYDIIKNGKEVSFQDILMRQSLIGGKYLLKFPPPHAWKYKHAVERTEFLQQFYQFIHERKNNESWSQWKLSPPFVRLHYINSFPY